MRLVVVYGIKTADYGYFSQFYPSRRINEECEHRSIPLRFLFPRDVPSFLAETALKPDIQHTVFLIRGLVAPAVVSLIENSGFRTINRGQSLILAGDKLLTARFLEKNRWPTPATNRAEEADAASFPLVAKPRFGSRGEGVRLVYTVDELKNLPENTIVQKFIESSAGRDLRFFFAGNVILAIAAREGADGSFISNASAGGRMSLPPFPDELLLPWKKMVHDIARASGLWYGSVDFLYLECAEASEKTRSLLLTVCEINGSPGFEALERDCGLNIAGALIDTILEDFVG